MDERRSRKIIGDFTSKAWLNVITHKMNHKRSTGDLMHCLIRQWQERHIKRGFERHCESFVLDPNPQDLKHIYIYICIRLFGTETD